MRILVKVIDPGGVETARPALHPMHHVALLQQELRQIATVLAGDTGDQSGFGGVCSGRGHGNFKTSCRYNMLACGHSGQERSSTISTVTC